MICQNCGQIIPDGSPACPVCWAQLGAAPQGYGVQQPYGAPGYGAPQQQYRAPQGYGASGAVSKTKDNIWSIFGGDVEDIEMAEKWGAKLDTGAYLNLSFYFLLAAGILLLLPPIIRAAKHQPPYEV